MICKGAKKGYMIVEIIMGMGLFVIITTLTMSCLVYQTAVNREMKAGIASRRDAEFALGRMAGEIRKADVQSIKLSGAGHILSANVAQVNERGITEFITVKYYVEKDRKRMYRMVNGTSNLMAQNIESVDFKWEEGILRITINSIPDREGRSFSSFTRVYPRIGGV